MGGLLVLILIGVVVYWCVKKKGKKRVCVITGETKNNGICTCGQFQSR